LADYLINKIRPPNPSSGWCRYTPRRAKRERKRRGGQRVEEKEGEAGEERERNGAGSSNTTHTRQHHDIC
jgi:hypothetical protein